MTLQNRSRSSTHPHGKDEMTKKRATGAWRKKGKRRSKDDEAETLVSYGLCRGPLWTTRWQGVDGKGKGIPHDTKTSRGPPIKSRAGVGVACFLLLASSVAAVSDSLQQEAFRHLGTGWGGGGGGCAGRSKIRQEVIMSCEASNHAVTGTPHQGGSRWLWTNCGRGTGLATLKRGQDGGCLGRGYLKRFRVLELGPHGRTSQLQPSRCKGKGSQKQTSKGLPGGCHQGG